MDVVQMFNAFKTYSLVVILLGVIVCLITQGLKKLLKNKIKKKFFTFLPFILGIAAYYIFHVISTFSFAVAAEELIEKGISVGLCATLSYVFYEQFIRNNDTNAIIELLDGIVVDEKRSETAQRIYLAIRSYDDEDEREIAQLILENAEDGVSESEARLSAVLILQTMKLKKKNA